MGKKVKLNIEELVDELVLLKCCEGVKKYKITETFKKKGTVSFIVENLIIEDDDDLIWTSDKGDAILNNNGVFSMFLKKNLVSINRHSLDERFCIQLQFNDGIITIESYYA